jgi:predicted flap endonuclease-1-like 5' DNA nuclease
MNSLWWLILGLLAGWLIELAIDYRYWRRQAQVTAARLAEQEAALLARSQALDVRQADLAAREEEVTTLQTTLAAKDAELLAQAQRTDQRAEEVARLEQAMDKRRADLDRMGLTLNEREKDIAARGELLKIGESDYAVRQEKLESSEADVARRLAVVSNRESAMQNWEARILAREHEVGDKEAELVRKAATATQLQASLEAMKALVSRQYKTPQGADDLQAIEGIGPEIAELLHSADIKTFERLSETSLGELTRILQGGGSRFGLADPLSWAEQASYLVEADFIGFEDLKEELIGGKRRDADLLQQAALDQVGSAGTPELAEPVIESMAVAPSAPAPADAGAVVTPPEDPPDGVTDVPRPFVTPTESGSDAGTADTDAGPADTDVGPSAGVSVEPASEADVSQPPR